MTICPSPQITVDSFADHVDAIPYYLGSTPSNALVITTVPTVGDLRHEVVPTGVPADRIDLTCSRGARMVILLAITARHSQGEQALYQALVAASRDLSPAAPRVTGGWANAFFSAALRPDGHLEAAAPRPFSAFAERALLDAATAR